MALSLEDFTGFEKLGAGGMGEVYCATQISLKRKVVLKKIAADLHLDRGLLKKFENEALFAAALDHDHIVHIYDLGEKDGELFLAMEYIDGADLEKLLIREKFPRLLGLMVVMQALKGLSYAHKKGIAHGDFKAGNILVSKAGRVKVTDFGLARRDSEVFNNSTGIRRFLTPAYMPPEHARRMLDIHLSINALSETTPITGRIDPSEENAENAGKTTAGDIWSAGVLMYRILCGGFPFSGESFSELADSILHAQAPDILQFAPFLPGDLADRIGSCLIKEPIKRPAELDPLIESLDSFFFSIGFRDYEKEIHSYMNDTEAATARFEKTLKSYSVQTARKPRESGDRFNAAGDRSEQDSDKTEWSRSSRAGSLALKIIAACITAAVAAVVVLQLLHVNILSGLIENYAYFRAKAADAQPEAASHQHPALSETAAAVQPETLAQPAQAFPETAAAVQPETFAQPAQALSEAPSPPVPDAETSRLAAVQTVSEGKKTVPEGNMRAARRAEKKVSPAQKKFRSTEKMAAVSRKAESGALKRNTYPIPGQVPIDGRPLSPEEPGTISKGSEQSPYEAAGEARSAQSVNAGLAQAVKITGFLHIYSYPWSELYIDGKLQGTTPTPKPLELAEGAHALELRRDGYKPYSGTVLIEKNETTRLQLTLDKIASSAP